MKNESLMYRLITTPLGETGLLTLMHLKKNKSSVIRILLPAKDTNMEQLIRKVFPQAVREGNDPSASLAERIEKYMRGEPVKLSIDELDWELCSDFQRRVLMKNYQVPRGRVITYKRIAEQLGMPNAARAVGRALASNPFPLIIPCHRVIRTDGSLGGFGGGLKMKKALLEMEGVRFNKDGQVSPESFVS